jgi:hypothetical protein
MARDVDEILEAAALLQLPARLVPAAPALLAAADLRDGLEETAVEQ